MKTTLVILASLVATFIVLIGGGIYAVLAHPEWILTQGRMRGILQDTGAFSKLPESLELKLDQRGLLGKKITLHATSFCLKQDDWDTCIQEAHVELEVKIVGLKKVQVVQVGPLKVLADTLLIHPMKAAPGTETKDGKGFFDYVIIPTDLKAQAIDIQAPKIVFSRPNVKNSPVIEGNVTLIGSDTDKLALNATAISNDGMKATAVIETGIHQQSTSPFRAQINATNGWRANAKIQGQVEWTEMHFDLAGEVALHRLSEMIGTVELKNLKLSRRPVLVASSDVFFKIQPQIQALEPVSKIAGKFSANEKDGSIVYDVGLGSIDQKMLTLKADLKGDYPKGPHQALVKIRMPAFEAWVQKLKDTRQAIPAPFSLLKGSIELEAGRDHHLDLAHIPFSVDTNLAGGSEAFKTQSKGEAQINPDTKKVKIAGNTVIQQLFLSLPNFDPLSPPPALKIDPRIQSQEEVKKEEPIPFEIDWKVDSGPGAVHLNYALFKPYAPLEVHFAIKNDEATGEVRVHPMDIDFLKRSAHVDAFLFQTKKGEPPYTYQGHLTIEKSEYTISIAINEKAGKPKMDLKSDPPLSESDIISVLLFNQTSSELTPDENDSVSNTQSAVANRALGLLSIWALSTTPIEAVNYNAGTGVYSARVKLPSGLTATIGTDWEKTQEVTLRKRLSRNFVLSTMVGRDTESNTESTKTLIEWFRRF